MTASQLTMSCPNKLSKKELMDMCKDMNIKRISKLKKVELLHILNVVKMQRLWRANKEWEPSFNRQDNIEEDELFPELHNKEDDLLHFINNNLYTVVFVYLSDCSICSNFKEKFYEFKHPLVEFGCLDMKKFEDNFGEVEDNEIVTFPAVQLCKRGIPYKTIYVSDFDTLYENIENMVRCIGKRALTDECEYRGLKTDVENLHKAIDDDDKLCYNIGFCLYEKTKEELIEYIEKTLHKKSKKHIQMDKIDLMNKIRKLIL